MVRWACNSQAAASSYPAAKQARARSPTAHRCVSQPHGCLPDSTLTKGEDAATAATEGHTASQLNPTQTSRRGPRSPRPPQTPRPCPRCNNRLRFVWRAAAPTMLTVVAPSTSTQGLRRQTARPYSLRKSNNAQSCTLFLLLLPLPQPVRTIGLRSIHGLVCLRCAPCLRRARNYRRSLFWAFASVLVGGAAPPDVQKVETV